MPNLSIVLFFSNSYIPTLSSRGQAKYIIWQRFLSFCSTMTSGLLSYISWSVCTLKSNSMLCLSFSITSSGLCSYHFYFTCISYFLHITQRIFILRSSFHNLFGLTCCIHLTHDTLFSFFTHSTFTVFLGLNHCFVIGSYSLFLCSHYQGFSCSF